MFSAPDKPECSERAQCYPSLQRTVQNLGDRLVGQMNSFELSVSNAIYNLTELLRVREENYVEREKCVEAMQENKQRMGEL